MKVVTCHLNADFDALSSLVAAAILHDAKLFFPGSGEKSVTQYYKNRIENNYELFIPKNCNRSIDTLILVDFSDKKRIHKAIKEKIIPDTKIIIYDHHLKDESSYENAVVHFKKYGSNTTQMVCDIKAKNIKISPDDATNLIIGIYVDTGSFKYYGTVPADLEAAAWLISQGADLKIVENIVSRDLEYDQISILNQFLINRKTVYIEGAKIAVSYSTNDEYISDIAIVVGKFLIISNLTSAICASRLRDKVYIIIRSRDPAIVDAKAVAKLFGGGGHSYAASAATTKTLTEVNFTLANWLRNLQLKSFRTEKLMSSPVVTINMNASIYDAESKMAKYAINSIPVVKGDKIAGILTRSLVERAIFHKLSSESVKKWMMTEFSTVGVNSSFETIRKIMIEGRQRFLPVIKEGKLVGAITRTDLFKVFDQIPRSFQTIKKNLTTLLKQRLDRQVMENIEKLGKLADRLNYEAYLIGGSVRDIILGNRVTDIDIAIIGNGILFAEKAAKLLGAKVSVHKEFMTAVIAFENIKIDIATSRNEYYNQPAALPTVEKGSLIKDLKRRDFTINTLALSLNPKTFGLLIDYFGGLSDIKEKKIRVLHNLSFVEDPTRIFRAIRFSVRYGFAVGRQTQRLMKNVTTLNIMKDLQPSRIISELSLIFDENKPSLIFERLSKLGVWKSLSAGDINISKAAIKRGESIISAYQIIFKSRIDKVSFYLMLIGLFVDLDRIEPVFERIGAANFIHKTILLRKNRNDLLRVLIRGSRSQAYKRLKELTIEARMALAAFTRSIKIRDRIIESIRFINEKPLLKGSDLIKIGFKEGPIIGETLKTIENMYIDGKINRYDEAIDYAKKFINENEK